MNNFFKRRRYLKNLRRLAVDNAGLDEPLSIMEDLVFKTMLTSDTEDSREALRSLLSACTQRPVFNARVTNNDLIPAHLNAKAVRVDVNVTFNDGEAADLEMQISKTDDDLRVRAEMSAAMLLTRQSRKGHHYKTIKRVYQIFFLNCILYPDSAKVPRRYSFREELEHDRLGVTEILFYEMPKLERYLDEKMISGLSDDVKWCMYMKYRHEKRAAGFIKKLFGEEAGIMRAEKAVNGIDRDYVKSIRKMNEIISSMDRASEIYNAKEKARAEGLAEGIATGMEKGLATGMEKGIATGMEKGTMEVARNLRKMNIPISQIAKGTGLSPEVIKQL